jgi:multidrug efflux system membrane fusion protein
VDSTTGTIRLKASFPNPKLRIWPGSFTNVRLKIETRLAALTIPPVAVQRGPAGAYVYVVKSDNTVTRRPVKIAHEDLSIAIVTDGLAEGERVVTDGASRLSEGAKVTVANPTAPDAPAMSGRSAP